MPLSDSHKKILEEGVEELAKHFEAACKVHGTGKAALANFICSMAIVEEARNANFVPRLDDAMKAKDMGAWNAVSNIQHSLIETLCEDWLHCDQQEVLELSIKMHNHNRIIMVEIAEKIGISPHALALFPMFKQKG